MKYNITNNKKGRTIEIESDNPPLGLTTYTTSEGIVRYNWIPMDKLFWWFLTFWKRKWNHFGRMEAVKPGEDGYERAHYSISIIQGPTELL